ncbi:ORF121 [Betabaculovirus altermyunipunctae]|uniref:ORF121 n=1 Tax=Betabaculovirus altermyunipunctae TaxID=3051996 RepID=A0A1S5YEE1_9BBAC|nr:ORF121 [Betabaculovirus altermyunipunctae]AQQ80388.1 ORF121 [Betabaculovirus altermyunipunctae]
MRYTRAAMDYLRKRINKRRHIISILGVLMGAKEIGYRPSKLCERLRYEYKRNNRGDGENKSLDTIVDLFQYFVSHDNIDWTQHVFTNDFYYNMTIVVCGRPNKNFSKRLRVQFKFYADSTLTYRVCYRCFDNIISPDNNTTFFAAYQYKQTVSSDDLYWFVCNNICDCCFTNKLFTQSEM